MDALFVIVAVIAALVSVDIAAIPWGSNPPRPMARER
jgi:hypothetical protein